MTTDEKVIKHYKEKVKNNPQSLSINNNAFNSDGELYLDEFLIEIGCKYDDMYKNCVRVEFQVIFIVAKAKILQCSNVIFIKGLKLIKTSIENVYFNLPILSNLEIINCDIESLELWGRNFDIEHSQIINSRINTFLSNNNNYIDVSFENTVFSGRVEFTNGKFIDCNFHLTEFHDNVYYNHAAINNSIFRFTEFRKQGAFYGVTFEDSPKFENLILKDTSHLYFENLNPDNSNLLINEFALTNTVINGRVDFSDKTIKCIDLKDSIIVGTFTRRNFTPDCANWQTATLLKNEEIKQNNLINALKYKAIEKDLYAKWLKYSTLYVKLVKYELLSKSYKLFKQKYLQLIPTFNIDIVAKQYAYFRKKRYRYFIKKQVFQIQNNISDQIIISDKNIGIWQIRFDRLSLWMSWAFNNHGQSWLRGIGVTLLSWIVTFTVFYLSIWLMNDVSIYKKVFSGSTFNTYFSSMIEYLSPTDYSMLAKYVKCTPSELLNWGVKAIGILSYF